MAEVSLARRMWTLFEPVHVVTYFAPEARAAFEAAGLRGFWRGYFAGRSAPLGPVGPGPVIATFFGFAPSTVHRALPDVWSRITPQGALDARLAGAVDSLRPAASDVDSELAALLRAAAESVDVVGRTLAAANADLPWPDDDLAAIWHATTILREHRGDGHIAALVAAGLDGCESLVWRTSLAHTTKDVLQPARAWTDEEWQAAVDRLVSRGWLTPDGEATDEARRAYVEIEAITDRLASLPWQRLGEAATERCAKLLGPLAVRAYNQLPATNPIGLPKPIVD